MMKLKSQSLAKLLSTIMVKKADVETDTNLYLFSYSESSHVKLEPLGMLSTQQKAMKVYDSLHLRVIKVENETDIELEVVENKN